MSNWKEVYLNIVKDLNERLESDDIDIDKYNKDLKFYNKIYSKHLEKSKEGKEGKEGKKSKVEYSYTDCLDALLEE